MSNKVWDEERIRDEFKKLDSITGLHGADLPITFGKAKHTLGCFYIDNINKLFNCFYFFIKANENSRKNIACRSNEIHWRGIQW